MTLLDGLRTLRAVRAFTDEPVSDETVDPSTARSRQRWQATCRPSTTAPRAVTAVAHASTAWGTVCGTHSRRAGR
jgi:hypothetical protein